MIPWGTWSVGEPALGEQEQGLKREVACRQQLGGHGQGMEANEEWLGLVGHSKGTGFSSRRTVGGRVASSDLCLQRMAPAAAQSGVN